MGEERKGWLDRLADKICKEEAPLASLVVGDCAVMLTLLSMVAYGRMVHCA